MCNYDNATSHGSANTTSLILLLSDETQKTMGDLVSKFETSIKKTGLHVVSRSNMEPFHCTVAKVPSGFPVDDAVAIVNELIKDWTNEPIVVSEIASLLPPALFHSSG